MDTKRMMTGMLLAMMVILGYQLVIAWVFKKNNWKIPGQDAPDDADRVDGGDDWSRVRFPVRPRSRRSSTRG